ncbi:hypothetical protein [uncultured Caulobacter sp.]|uniref:hypothetical protein n=1 Tax=uncultured Caulobacter sp. TaxID=158749 RepID=UPI002636C062|nr:hypothetical protein [uncultured Caulobacter sp.]
MKTLTHPPRADAPRDHGAAWAALLVVAIVGLAVWGAWTLGVMAGDKADWRQAMPDVSRSLRKAPDPQPAPTPLQRRPMVSQEHPRG